jgi:hypothetical protein
MPPTGPSPVAGVANAGGEGGGEKVLPRPQPAAKRPDSVRRGSSACQISFLDSRAVEPSGHGGALSRVVSAVVLLLVFAVSDVQPLVER